MVWVTQSFKNANDPCLRGSRSQDDKQDRKKEWNKISKIRCKTDAIRHKQSLVSKDTLSSQLHHNHITIFSDKVIATG